MNKQIRKQIAMWFFQFSLHSCAHLLGGEVLRFALASKNMLVGIMTTLIYNMYEHVCVRKAMFRFVLCHAPFLFCFPIILHVCCLP